MPSITFSFDDTTIDNYKLYGLMSEYQYKVIWFLDFRDKKLAEEQIRLFKEKHEIGVHGYEHKLMTRIPLNEACEEIRKGRDAVQKLTGRPKIYCPPRGYVNPQLVNLIKAYGFDIIRLTTVNGSNKDGVIGRTIHIYSRPEYEGLTWYEYAEKKIDDGEDVWIWGHSWELTKFKQWDKLKHFLDKYKNV